MKRSDRKGQVTIFIIVAVVLIVAVGLFFLLRSDILPDVFHNSVKNPEAFLQTCFEDEVYEIVNKLSVNGGYISNPLNISFMFSEEGIARDVPYLCYNVEDYKPCVNQEIDLIGNFEKQVKLYLDGENQNEERIVDECLKSLEESYEKDGYDVSVRKNGFEVDLRVDGVMIDINHEISLTKGDESRIEKNFEVYIPSKIYSLLLVAQEAVSKEAQYCAFDYLGYMKVYPEIKIDKFTTQDGSIIYTMTHRDSEEFFRFAIRGCVFPPGI